MTRYEAIEKALRKLIADYESEIHDNYDGTSFLSHRMAEVDDAKDALALPEDGKVVNAELYGLAVELADSYAWINYSDADPRYSRYLSLREASGEAMPYKVVMDGDKVRFV